MRQRNTWKEPTGSTSAFKLGSSKHILFSDLSLRQISSVVIRFILKPVTFSISDQLNLVIFSSLPLYQLFQFLFQAFDAAFQLQYAAFQEGGRGKVAGPEAVYFPDLQDLIGF